MCTQDKQSELGNAATEYARKGWKIAPLRPRRKKAYPYSDYKKASNKEDYIKEVWDKLPRSNIALPTSIKYNGIVIIDIDIKHGIDGRILMKEIVEKNGLYLPKTCIAKSGSGGFHYYYKIMDETPIMSSNGTWGIDIRAEGGYAILPPSVYMTGEKYEWIEGNLDSIANITEDVKMFISIVNDINNNKR